VYQEVKLRIGPVAKLGCFNTTSEKIVVTISQASGPIIGMLHFSMDMKSDAASCSNEVLINSGQYYPLVIVIICLIYTFLAFNSVWSVSHES
jgi:hypothetical protein